MVYNVINMITPLLPNYYTNLTLTSIKNNNIQKTKLIK